MLKLIKTCKNSISHLKRKTLKEKTFQALHTLPSLLKNMQRLVLQAKQI